MKFPEFSMAAVLRYLRRAEQSGSLYAAGAVASAAAAGAFFLAGEGEKRARIKLADELDGRVGTYKSKEPAHKAEPVPADAPTLWRGTIATAMPGLLAGELMLRGAKAGDAVEVLAEEVGPGESYLHCRNPSTGAVGLYPQIWVRHPVTGVPTNAKPLC